MRSRFGQFHQSMSLLVLGALLSLSPPSLLKAQPNTRDPSINRFRAFQTSRVVLSAATGRQVRDEVPIIVNTDLVTLNVSVVDRSGHLVTGLDKRAFSILDNKSPQEIVFFSDADAPVSVSIVFDLSESMSGEKIKLARAALAHFIETSLNSDEYTLIVFSESPQVLLDRTRDGKAMIDRLSAAVPHGTTALYDACYLGVERLTGGTYPKRVLLLISDGQDNNSHYNFDEVRSLLRESDVVFYSIGIADPIQLTGKAGARVRYALEGLAEITGGKAFFPSNEAQMDEIFERIALELRRQYSIGYRPQNFAGDGKWHRIRVRVNPPNGTAHLSVRSRAGYYAPAGLR
jgi:Ca-activated chloride channel homolog